MTEDTNFLENIQDELKQIVQPSQITKKLTG